MPYTEQDLQRRRNQVLSRHRGRTMTGPLSAAPEQDRNLGILGTAGDILAGIPRGLEAAAQDVYGLADTLTMDVLPDWEERIFGHSRTRLGGLVEGVSNFAAGFIPVFGGLGKVGKLGRVLGGTKILRGAVAGAITDFAVFDGHEERLSNLIQTVPSLQNPITEFLAADPEDSEIEGRLKNTLEGLGIGALVDGVLLSLKALRAGRAARAKGLNEEAVEVAMDEAVPPAQLRAALRKGNDLVPPSTVPTSAAAPEAAAAAVDDATLTTPRVVAEAPQTIPAAAPVTGGDPATRQLDILRTFDIDEKTGQALIAEARRRSGPINPDLSIGAPLDPAVNPRRLSEAERLAQGMQKTDLNMSRYQGPEGAMQLIRSMEQLLEPLESHGRANAKTLSVQEADALDELADMVQEKNPQRLLALMQEDVADIRALNRRVLAYKTAFLTYSDYVERLAHAIQKPATATDAARLEFRQALSTMAEMELAVKGLLGEQGRGLGANRIPTRVMADLFDNATVAEALAEHGGAKRTDELAAKFLMVKEGAGVAGVVDLARATAGRRGWAIFDEYWYNSLLGRPTTMVVNAMSGMLTTIFRPLELMAGGALTLNSEVMGEAVREIVALVQSAPEAMRSAAAAMRSGGNLFDPKRLVHDTVDPLRKAITAKNVGLADDSIAGAAVNWAGRLIRFPSAALTATDQFVKHLNYRAVVQAQLAKEASARGLDRQAAAAFIADEMDRLLFEGQAYGSAMLYNRGAKEAIAAGKVSKAAVEAHAKDYVRRAVESGEHARLSSLAGVAIDRAEEVTFTKALRPGSMSWRLQDAARHHRLLRLVVPFVRTPINIATFAMQRMDGIGAAKAFAARPFPSYAKALESTRNRMIGDLLSHDPRRAADAIGRLAAGISISSWVFMKASSETPDGMPLVTGQGPKDREQRRLLEQAGWQPYSIRVGDGYVSYARVDPFATILGTAADVVDYIRFAPPEDQDVVENLSLGMAAALAQNFTNKTYLAGLANAVEALQDPNHKVPKLVAGFTGSLVPGQAAAVVSITDPLMRDVRGIMDQARSRWPGASDDLPPMRNVLGEPVFRAKSLGGDVSSMFNAVIPILYRETSDDTVNRELAALGHGFTPPKRTRGSLDLTTVVNRAGQNAYDRWLELHGTVELGGRTLRESMRRLIASQGYQRIPQESTSEFASPRVNLIQARINDYRQAAWRQLLREYPDLAKAERARVESRTRAKAGRSVVSTLQGGR